tara:strand:- start:1633 stop:2799 length:1167 start_codon:yes stop_codon:yes gene_type:complete
MQKKNFNESIALRVTLLGLFANFFLAISKVFIGFLSNSSALIADAAHSFSDLLSDGITLWAVKMSNIPKDKNHPYGHGKFETIGTFFVSIMLISTGIGVAWHVFNKIDYPEVPGIISLWMAGLAIVIKEILFHITRIVSKKTSSKILLANAWHHRSDSISSIAALIGIGGSQLGIPLMDPLAGVLVAGIIVKTGINIGYESIKELTDETVEEEIIRKLSKIMDGIEGVEHYHEMRARKMGPHLLVDLHIQVNNMISISSAHQIAERVRLTILNMLPSVNEVLVHVDAEDDFLEENEVHIPIDVDLMRPQEKIENDVKKVLKELPEILGITHIYCHYLNKKLTVQVNIILDSELKISDAQLIASRARRKIEKIKDIDYADLHLELEDNN